MSDNPNGETDLFSLGFDVDESGIEQSAAGIDRIANSETNLANAITAANEAITEQASALDTSRAMIESVSGQVDSFGSALASLESQGAAGVSAVNELFIETDQAVQKLSTDIDDVSDKMSRLQSFRQGVGPELGPEAYGMPSMAELGLDEGQGFGGFGNVLPEARGLRAFGGLARLTGAGPEVSGAATGGADILFMVRGLQQIGDFLPALNTSLEASGGLIPPLTSALADLGVPMAGLLATGGPLVIAFGALAVSVANFISIIQAGQAEVDKSEKNLVDFYQTLETGTDDSIKKEIDKQQAIKDANDRAVQDNLPKINALIDQYAATLEGVSAQEIQRMKDNAAKGIVDTDITPLSVIGGPLVDLINHVKDMSTTSSDAAQKIADLNNAIASLDAKGQEASQKTTALAEAEDVASGGAEKLKHAVNEVATALEEAGKQNTALSDITKRQDQEVAAYDKYQKDVANIIEQGNVERANIEKKYADERIKITQDTAQAQSDALLKLKQTEADDLTKLQQDMTDDRTKEQRKEADAQLKLFEDENKDLTDHLRRMQDIRNNAQAATEDALLNRDFLSLYQQQRKTNDQLDVEQTRYERQEADRQTAFDVQTENDRIAYTRQEADRQVAYQRQLETAQLHYNRELEALQAKEGRELQAAYNNYTLQLNELEQKLTNELLLRRQAAIDEINIINETEQQKRAIYEQTLAQVQAMMQQASSSPNEGAFGPAASGGLGSTGNTGSESLSGIQQFASGGDFDAGKPFVMSEAGPETLDIAGARAGLSGAALVYPLQSGSVSQGGGGSMVFSPTVNVYESKNAQETAREIRRELGSFVNGEIAAAMEKVFGQ